MSLIEDKRIQVLIVIIIFMISGYVTLVRKSKLNLYKENNWVTNGIIIDYYSLGAEVTYYIRFSYQIEGITYKHSYSTSSLECLEDCDYTKDCIGKRIRVYFNPENPKDSLLDTKNICNDFQELNSEKDT